MDEQDVDIVYLEELEAYSVEIARKAGSLLHEHFNRPLEVEFKGKGKTDPVTVADRLAEEYLKAAIVERYPRHSIVSEEGGVRGKEDSPFVWVVDPLDGTANFMNGLPFFAVSIGVLWKLQPVVGSIYVPVGHNGTPGVYHARLGNGSYLDGDRIEVTHAPTGRPLSAMPPGGFRLSGQSRRAPHEVRNTGSIAVELALTSCGVFQYALFVRPRIWDVAAGVLLVREAGGVVLSRQGNGREWLPPERFEPRLEDDRTPLQQLQRWSAPVVAGAPSITERIVKDLRSTPLAVRSLRWLRRRFGAQHKSSASQASRQR